MHVADFFIITGHLYKMGPEKILQRYVPNFEQISILTEDHGGVVRGHHVGKATTQKVLCDGFCAKLCIMTRNYIVGNVMHVKLLAGHPKGLISFDTVSNVTTIRKMGN